MNGCPRLHASRGADPAPVAAGEAAALAAWLDVERAAHRAAGVHLVAVQSVDGSRVVGGSHAYAAPHSARHASTR